MDNEKRLALFQQAKLKEASGDMEAADQIYASLIEEKGFGPSFTKEEQKLLYQSYYRRLSINLHNKRLALKLAADIVSYFHKDAELEESYLVDLARIYVRLEEPMAAYDLLQRLIKHYPESKHLSEGCFLLGRICHEEMGEPAKAIPYYSDYLARTKENKRLVASLLADCFMAVGDIKSAQRIIDRYTNVQVEKDGR